MKLYDEVLGLPKFGSDPAGEDRFDVLTSSVQFDVSNVSKYLQRHEMTPGDLPSIMPPFATTWWETSVSNGDIRRCGASAHVTGYRMEDGSPFYRISQHDYGDRVMNEMAEEVYWTVWTDMHPHPGDKDRDIGPMKGGLLKISRAYIGIPLDHLGRPFLDADGRIIGRDLRTNPLIPHKPGMIESYEQLTAYEETGVFPDDSGWSVALHRDATVQRAIKYIWPFLVAIGFSHCKNVEMVDAPELPYKVRRKQELKLGRPLVKFKELIIDPSMTQKRYANPTKTEDDDDRHHKSLHIVRGHFATYGEDNKLFGKYTGTFWKPAHTRGSDEVGTVYKDYRVRP